MNPSERPPILHEGMPTQLPDIDPDETADWVSSLNAMIESRGRERARYVMLRLLERARLAMLLVNRSSTRCTGLSGNFNRRFSTNFLT